MVYCKFGASTIEGVKAKDHFPVCAEIEFAFKIKKPKQDAKAFFNVFAFIYFNKLFRLAGSYTNHSSEIFPSLLNLSAWNITTSADLSPLVKVTVM